MRTSLAAAATATLVLLSAPPAVAGSVTKSDPDDVGTVLDLARVSLTTTGSKIVGTIATHDAFGNDHLEGGPNLGIDFRIRGTGDRITVRGVAVRSVDGRLRATVCTYTSKAPQGKACSKVAVKRLSPTSVRVTVPRAKIARGAKTYRWRGGSFTPDGMIGCTTSPFCLDTMVDNPRRWFRLRG